MYGHRTPTPPLRWVGAAVVAGLALGYTLAVEPTVASAEQVVYPVVWLLASGLALWRVRDRLPDLGRRALAVGAAYTLVLLFSAGLVGSPTGSPGMEMYLAAPGWGPALVYGGPVVRVVLIPFLIVGYLTLGLLGALAVHRTLRAAAPGVLGLFACVSCTAPLLAGLAGSLGSGSLAATLLRAQYPVATAVFLLSVGLFLALLGWSRPPADA
ncbi:MAG: hypothetical protein V5A30_00385 [Haloarculaceae archaeon]